MSRRFITFVCTANTCRSPMAERLLAHALAAESGVLNRVRLISCGVAAHEGEPPAENSVRALRVVGVSLENHRSRQVTQSLLDETWVLFGMTASHLRALRSRFDKLPPHVLLMREFVRQGATREIPDPYGGGITDYKECCDSMIEAIPGILRFLRETAGRDDGFPEV